MKDQEWIELLKIKLSGYKELAEIMELRWKEVSNKNEQQQTRIDNLEKALLEAAELLEKSAQPFDDGCMVIKRALAKEGKL